MVENQPMNLSLVFKMIHERALNPTHVQIQDLDKQVSNVDEKFNEKNEKNSEKKCRDFGKEKLNKPNKKDWTASSIN
jgi:hypothetical protein